MKKRVDKNLTCYISHKFHIEYSVLEIEILEEDLPRELHDEIAYFDNTIIINYHIHPRHQDQNINFIPRLLCNGLDCRTNQNFQNPPRPNTKLSFGLIIGIITLG